MQHSCEHTGSYKLNGKVSGSHYFYALLSNSATWNHPEWPLNASNQSTQFSTSCIAFHICIMSVDTDFKMWAQAGHNKSQPMDNKPRWHHQLQWQHWQAYKRVTAIQIHTSHWHWSTGICTMLTAFFLRSFAFFTVTTASIRGEEMPSARGHLWLWITDMHFLCRSCIAQWAQHKEYPNRQSDKHQQLLLY